MVIGQVLKVRLRRDYGRFWEKPCLPMGEHTASVILPHTEDEANVGLRIDRNGHPYYVEAKDVEVLEVVA